MEESNIRAELRTGIDLKPERSQVFVVTLALISAICLSVGFLFLWFKPEYSWVPLTVGLCIVAGSIYTWQESHKDIDLANATPTSISDKRSGVDITTDTRVLAAPEIVRHLERLFSSLSHRIPLPEPDGLVDNRGSPLPGKKQEAIERVQKVNEEAADLTKKAMIFMIGEKPVQSVEQPLIEAPASEVSVGTNAAKEE